jgi:lipoyl(octanoyl) transferase
MNKSISLKDLGVKDYKETWDYQTALLQEIADVKIDNQRNDKQKIILFFKKIYSFIYF